MPKFNVDLERTCTETVTVTVEASDLEAARREAYAVADDVGG